MDDGVCFYWREVAPPISHTVVHVSCILAVSCKLTVRPGRRAEAREHPRARGRPDSVPPWRGERERSGRRMVRRSGPRYYEVHGPVHTYCSHIDTIARRHYRATTRLISALRRGSDTMTMSTTGGSMPGLESYECKSALNLTTTALTLAGAHGPLLANP